MLLSLLIHIRLISESNIIIQKEPEECRETSSQIKRRRMLQFNTQDGDNLLSDEQMSLEYLKLKVSFSSFELD